MNRAGGTAQPFNDQRASASTPVTKPLSIATCGMNHASNASFASASASRPWSM